MKSQMCIRCVMDTSASDITFNESGVCNYCTSYINRTQQLAVGPQMYSQQGLNSLIEQIKKDGINKPYDCIVGVSGGVDSSWVLVKAVEQGLRPLAVHMDNGWNSELAQSNIENLVRTLKVDLFTYVIDWSEYRKLMQAFFDADVVDIELLYDNATLAVNYRQAQKYNLQYILSGSNRSTEGMPLPKDWNWFKLDKRNISGIARSFGNVKIKSFPTIGTLDYIYFTFYKKIKWVPFLDYYEYNKFDVLDRLEQNFNYKRYPFKHYESIFTRFYQGYILPRKFNIDKRHTHLSTLIASGQMTRDDALASLVGIPYPSEHDLQSDIDYFLKKMGWNPMLLEIYLNRAEVSHSNYSSEKYLWDFLFNRLRVILPSSLKRFLKKNT
jgi:N-acetyl sugar amidotransferase